MRTTTLCGRDDTRPSASDAADRNGDLVRLGEDGPAGGEQRTAFESLS